MSLIYLGWELLCAGADPGGGGGGGRGCNPPEYGVPFVPKFKIDAYIINLPYIYKSTVDILNRASKRRPIVEYVNATCPDGGE